MDADEKSLVDLSHFWDSEEVSERNYCDCPGPPPPPQFLLPPPPPPPSLDLCRNGAAGDQSDLQFCHLEPVGAEYTQTAFPSLPIIVVCSSVVLVAILVASYLLWKHKKKVQNFLPCKSEPNQAHHLDMTGSNGVTYDDVLINRHPTRLPNHHHAQDTRHGLTPIELLDVKYGSYGPGQLAPLSHTNFTFAPNPQKESGHGGHHHGHHHHHGRGSKNKDHFNPIYEEVSGCSEEKPTSRSYDSDIEDSEAEARTVASEDEFAEDELSLAEFPRPATGTGTRPCSGSTGGDLCRDVGSVSSEGAGSEGGHSENRGELRGLFRVPRGGGVNGSKGRGIHQPKHTHSLERNKDGHPSEGFLAKQNYYMSKSMLGPDLAGGLGSPSHMTKTSSVGNPYQEDSPGGLANPYGHSMGRLTGGNGPEGTRYHPAASNHLGNESQSPFAANARKDNAYGGKIRLPGGLLSELNHKLVGNGGGGPVPNRTLPSPGVPTGTRPAPNSAAPVFTVDPDEPYPPPSMGGSRARGVTDFSTFHPYPPTGRVNNPSGVPIGGLPSPPPPPAENIYASVEEDGPFTIDGGHSRGGSFSATTPGRQNGGDFIKTSSATGAGRLVGGGTRGTPNTNTSSAQPGSKTLVPKDSGQKGHLANQRTPAGAADEESASYGDIMPIYDTRTAFRFRKIIPTNNHDNILQIFVNSHPSPDPPDRPFFVLQDPAAGHVCRLTPPILDIH